jgi:XTP/dITP diphosphohydrolase
MRPIEKLVIASHNRGKIAEIDALVRPLGIQVASAVEYNLSEPEETGSTFVANAQIKSHSAAQESGLPSLADDSGLVVPALDGAPGIYSARWGGEKRDFNLAMERVCEALLECGANPEGTPAHFICVLSLAWPEGEEVHFEGKVQGHLTFPPRGEKGFGYDPIFIPNGYNMTFAEMEPDAKHGISHRARAFRKFVSYVEQERLCDI